MSPVVLRDYQVQLADDIREAMRQHRRVLAVAPTGSGKTVIFCHYAQATAAKGRRVVIVAHRVEICDQISVALHRVGVKHGRVAPGHPATDDLVQVAMVQTLVRRLDKIPEPALLVVDEAHHAVAETYSKITEAWQKARILGVTATPERLDGRGLGDAFDVMVYGPSVEDLIATGYLAGFTYLAPPAKVNLTGVTVRAGDYALDQLAVAVDRSEITGDVIVHYRRHLGGRPAIAFCVSVAHAEHVAEQFRDAGYRAASVNGAMAPIKRRDLIESIGDGRLDVLCACDIISEGTDIPVVAGAILLRPTQSVALYRQQVGRALRPKPDGSRAVILDHVGAVRLHGLPDMPRAWSLESEQRSGNDEADAEPKIAVCNACHEAFAMRPGWKTAPCDDEPDCVMARTFRRAAPEVVNGDLQEVNAAERRLHRLRTAPLQSLLTGRETRGQLEEIRLARGYKPGWVWHVLQDRKAAGESRPTN